MSETNNPTLHFEMQIKIDERWHSIHPTGGRPYQYPTRREAREMLNICYPDVPPTDKRVAPIIDDGEAIRALLVNYERDVETLPPGMFEKVVSALMIDLGDWLRENIQYTQYTDWLRQKNDHVEGSEDGTENLPNV